MAQRITDVAQVKAVLTRDYDLNKKPDLQPFIDTAVAITDRVETCAVSKGMTLTAAELLLIERWLAAHFYKHAYDRQFSNKSSAGASAGFTGQSAMYLEGTTYGQNALSVDYSGCLLSLVPTSSPTQRRIAGAAWLGKRKSEQTLYRDRR